uniref:Uncharacterized protein n=1 Tax=Glossina pallidipes TaxID=7398 RepID=A0A1A9Z6Q1_GLOPL
MTCSETISDLFLEQMTGDAQLNIYTISKQVHQENDELFEEVLGYLMELFCWSSEGKLKGNSHSKMSGNSIVKQPILGLPHKRADDENGFSNWNFVQTKNNLNSEFIVYSLIDLTSFTEQ